MLGGTSDALRLGSVFVIVLLMPALEFCKMCNINAILFVVIDPIYCYAEI